MESFINFKLEEWLLKGDGLDSVEVQNMDYVLEFDEFVRSIKQNMDTKFSMFLGAGASVESGVPSAGECIWEWKRDIFISKNPVRYDKMCLDIFCNVREMFSMMF